MQRLKAFGGATIFSETVLKKGKAVTKSPPHATQKGSVENLFKAKGERGTTPAVDIRMGD